MGCFCIIWWLSVRYLRFFFFCFRFLVFYFLSYQLIHVETEKMSDTHTHTHTPSVRFCSVKNIWGNLLFINFPLLKTKGVGDKTICRNSSRSTDPAISKTNFATTLKLTLTLNTIIYINITT